MAARIVRPQRRVRAERRAAASPQDSHRQQRRDRRQLPHRCQRRVEPGFRIGNGVFIGRNSILSCKNGDIDVADRREHRVQLRAVLGQPASRVGPKRAAGGATATSSAASHEFSIRRRAVLAQDAHLVRRHHRRRAPGLGAGAKILDGVTIGAHAVIGAGAVVRESVPPGPSPSASLPASFRPRTRRHLWSDRRTSNVESRSPRPEAYSEWPRLAIVTSSPPSVEGGHLVIARSLETAAREAGHDAPRTSLLPSANSAGRRPRTSTTWRTDVNAATGPRIDQVISLRFPELRACHPAHVCWLESHDAWSTRSMAEVLSGVCRSGDVRKNGSDVLVISTVDRWLLTHNVTRVDRPISHRSSAGWPMISASASAVVLPPPRPSDAIAAWSRGMRDFGSPSRDLDTARASRHSSSGAAGVNSASRRRKGRDCRRWRPADWRSRSLVVEALGLSSRVTLLGQATDETLLRPPGEMPRRLLSRQLAEDYWIRHG